MIKETIKVPGNIEYISDWTDYELPKGHVIVDKGVTGCGYTEYCLRNNKNVILCSPRKLLLENKRDQHKDDLNIFYLENDPDNTFTDVTDIYTKIQDHVLKCQLSGLPCKILVTYDSSYLVFNALKRINCLDLFYVVIDEMQSIFLDSYFKCEVENDFLEYLQDCPNALYLSATPMLDKYLEQLDEFKNLKFQKLDWSDSKYVEKVHIRRKQTTSLGKECKKIINNYLNNKFETILDESKKLIESKEAVFYFNSLSEIIRVINSTNLQPSQANIICSDTEENRRKLKKIKFTVSKVPLKNETNKMFTFCTKSVYIGADFHSDCASSYVFADPNIDCLSLDISLDLPQIVGR